MSEETSEKKINPLSLPEPPGSIPPLPAGMAQQILTSVSDPITVVSRDFKIIWMNGPRAAMRRRALTEIKGRRCYEIFNEDSAVCPDCPVAETIHTGLPSSHECFADLCNGKGAWTESYTWPIFDNQGEVLYVVHYSRDITERKLAEKALREERDRAQKYLDIAGVMLVVIDAEQKVEAINKKGCEVLGYREEEILGKNWFDNFLPVRFKRPTLQTFQELMAGEAEPLSNFENSILTRDGTEKVIAWHHTVLRDHEGRIKATLSSGEDVTSRKQAERSLRQSFESLQRIIEETVNALASVLEKRDPYTANHQQRVAQLACAIAREMKLIPEQIEGLRVAAILHDIGKINIPSEILNRPGELNEMEMALIKTHSQVGHDIVKKIPFAWPVAPIVLQHQERLDGSGYPHGLTGEKILLEARILGVADVVEGMVSHRPYRPAHGLPRALEEIQRHRGVLYDPPVVDACVRLFKDKGFTFDEP